MYLSFKKNKKLHKLPFRMISYHIPSPVCIIHMITEQLYKIYYDVQMIFQQRIVGNDIEGMRLVDVGMIDHKLS